MWQAPWARRPSRTKCWPVRRELCCGPVQQRDARLGVMSVGDGTLEPFRVSSDPLRSVWPKLNAAGILTGSVVII